MKPEPGMHIRTEGLSEEDYHAVAKVFMDAGAKRGEYGDYSHTSFDFFGWRGKEGLFFAAIDAFDSYGTNPREVTVDELLGRDKGWDGEGLPPVGTRCEVLIAELWFECVMLTCNQFAALHDEDWSLHGIYGATKFRPLRSERERAEEREIIRLVERLKDCETSGDAVRVLGDFGYRKTEGES